MHIRRRVERVRRGQASVADATVLYQRMLHILKRRGYQKPLWFTPAEFAASLPAHTARQLGRRVHQPPTTHYASAVTPRRRPSCRFCWIAWNAPVT